MKDFDEIIAPYLSRKYRVYTIDRNNPRKKAIPNNPYVLQRTGTPVITPLGRFKSGREAAEAHGLSISQLWYRIQTKREGFYYDDTKLSSPK